MLLEVCGDFLAGGQTNHAAADQVSERQVSLDIPHRRAMFGERARRQQPQVVGDAAWEAAHEIGDDALDADRGQLRRREWRDPQRFLREGAASGK